MKDLQIFLYKKHKKFLRPGQTVNRSFMLGKVIIPFN